MEFPPDICSRVTFVNFTVTRSSLQNQCLNTVLKAERPDVDAKRADLLKMQGEFQLKLRHLEKDLLTSLNESKGNILDDDRIIGHLETLKKEAAEVGKKVEETDVIMAEVDAVSQQYVPLALACSNVYFTLEAMNQIYFLYQFSLQFFLDIFSSSLYQNKRLESLKDYGQRLSAIMTELFQITYNRVARGMLNQDHITFAMLLARISLKGDKSEPTYELEFQHFLHSQDATMMSAESVEKLSIKIPYLSNEQNAALSRLKLVPAFNRIDDVIKSDEKAFKTWVESGAPEENVLELWENSDASDIGKALYSLLVMQAVRPDRLLATVHLFVVAVFDANFMDSSASSNVDLGGVVEHEIKSDTPVLLCSVPGYDPSQRVEDLASESGKQLSNIAIGSAEGFNQAEKAINAASKAGMWVMLKNVHLAPGWLVQLEKKLHQLQTHQAFRLFLTMEITPKLPVNLLRAGRVFVFEPPPGIRANLLRTFGQVSAKLFVCKVNTRDGILA